MSEGLILKVNKRTETGKGPAGRIRAEGRIPGVLYGDGKDPVSLVVEPKQLEKILRSESGRNTIFDLEMEGTGQRRPVMIHGVQRKPVGQALMHADFMRINMSKKVEVEVPIVLDGIPDGVKTHGGILDFLHRKLAVECLPNDIPTAVHHDITGLGVGGTVKVADLTVDAARIRVMDDKDTVIALVALPAAEQAAATEETAAATEAAPDKKDKAEAKAE